MTTAQPNDPTTMVGDMLASASPGLPPVWLTLGVCSSQAASAAL